MSKETAFNALPVVGKSAADLKPKERYKEKAPAGSALALSVAQNGARLKASGRLLTVICSDPGDVIRLAEEVRWFDPSLRLSVFPDWETTFPTTFLSPACHLVGRAASDHLLKFSTAILFQGFGVDVRLRFSSTALQQALSSEFIRLQRHSSSKGPARLIRPTSQDLVMPALRHVHKCAQGGSPFAADFLDIP